MDNIYVMAFILIIVVIMFAKTMTEALLIISMIMNVLAVDHLINMAAPAPAAASSHDIGEKSQEPPKSADHAAPSMYGPEYDEWNSYRFNPAPQPRIAVASSGAECNNNIDSANALLAQKRTRDRRCTDGWLTKDTNYFRLHYGQEFDQTERKEWWGAKDY